MGQNERYHVKILHSRLWIVVAMIVTFAIPSLAQSNGVFPPCPAAGAYSLHQDCFLPYAGGAAYFRRWSLGPPSTESWDYKQSIQDYFPIGVWLQSPDNAGKYESVGVNAYIGLWDGTVETSPTDGPILIDLRHYGMPVFGDQATGLSGPYAAEHLTDPIIEGWTQMDEPDNAQPGPNGTYVACVSPSTIIARYKAFVAADPNRPVFLGLGQGTGWDVNSPYYGRGSVCNEPSRSLNDYPKYIQGADVVTSDVYPENDHHPLWWIGRTVDRLRSWANYKKPVWQWIELANIDNDPSVSVTPFDIKAEVYMTLIHGGLGIAYFVHQFAPVFEEDSIFYPEHAAAKAAVAAINTQVTALAPVLNTPSVGNGVVWQSSNPNTAINVMLKRQGGSTFLFAINDTLPPGGNPLTETGLSGGPTIGTFKLRDFPKFAKAIVLGENRTIPIINGVFSDTFSQSYSWHLYQILYDPNPGAPKIGDVNGDGVVDCVDVQRVKESLGKTAIQKDYDPAADLIRDGVINSLDLALVEQKCGEDHPNEQGQIQPCSCP